MSGYIGTKAVTLSTTTASVGGDSTVGGDLTVDTNTLYVDSTNNRVGVGTVSPSATLDVNGTIKLDGNYPVGTDNVALGDTALDSLTTGTSNVAIGSGALTAGTEADRNIAIGTSALSTATTGVRNVAIGHIAGAAISSGSYNTAIGAYSLISNTTASNNVAVGYLAGYSATTGNNNTFVGKDSGYWVTTGARNSILGAYSGNQGSLDIRTSSNNIVLSDGDGNPQISVMQDGFTYFNKSGDQFTLSGLQRGAINASLTDSSLARNGIILSNVDASYVALATQASGAHNYYVGYFRNSSSTVVGTIIAGTSSTSFNTTSDYRLKENVVELTGATDRLKQLEPKRFNFIVDPDKTVDGFLAHEVQAIVPEAITGTHNEVDADGNPLYQGIDQSKLVPLLVATIKELEARITALETENTAIKARLDALEGN